MIFKILTSTIGVLWLGLLSAGMSGIEFPGFWPYILEMMGAHPLSSSFNLCSSSSTSADWLLSSHSSVSSTNFSIVCLSSAAICVPSYGNRHVSIRANLHCRNFRIVKTQNEIQAELTYDQSSVCCIAMLQLRESVYYPSKVWLLWCFDALWQVYINILSS